ncbi:MAG: Hsp20 family protein [Salinispira sp.]
MKKHDFIDIRVFLDEIFGVAENFKDAFTKEFGQWECCGPNSNCCQDFYPAYSYPPVNVYITENRTMVLQFALAGFAESDITLEFRGDYLVFSADISNDFEPGEHVKYFKKRLKLKSIQDQRYFVPADKYYQDKVTAVFNNAILTVTILPRDQVMEDEGVKVNIKTEKKESGQK